MFWTPILAFLLHVYIYLSPWLLLFKNLSRNVLGIYLWLGSSRIYGLTVQDECFLLIQKDAIWRRPATANTSKCRPSWITKWTICSSECWNKSVWIWRGRQILADNARPPETLPSIPFPLQMSPGLRRRRARSLIVSRGRRPYGADTAFWRSSLALLENRRWNGAKTS